jgi:hypothetical protein
LELIVGHRLRDTSQTKASVRAQPPETLAAVQTMSGTTNQRLAQATGFPALTGIGTAMDEPISIEDAVI